MSRETESNRRPKDVNQSPLQSSALPTELSPQTVRLRSHDNVQTAKKIAKSCKKKKKVLI